MQTYIYKIEKFLEWLDSFRDKFLFLFIKPYWPRKITPNHISYSRAVIGVVLFIILFFFGIEDRFLIILLFCIGVITDFIDGPIARATNQVTEFGAMLDSTSDRIILIPIAVYVLFPTHKLLLFILFLIEILNAATSIYYKSKETYLESDIFGKIKMTLMSIVFIAILITFPSTPLQIFIHTLWLTIPLTLLSASIKILNIKNIKYKI